MPPPRLAPGRGAGRRQTGSAVPRGRRARHPRPDTSPSPTAPGPQRLRIRPLRGRVCTARRREPCPPRRSRSRSHHTSADEAFLRKFLRPQTVLGAAVQLCTLPWLGFVPDEVPSAPPAAVGRLARQLGLPVEVLRGYGVSREQMRTDQLRQVAKHLADGHCRRRTPA
ncbi:DUF4158 domain-containing protein [Streptomyces sp. NPDC050636]|uniref:DUF4158 domain-containing protein n=1 Tax=Streptomyces sp. NPDC050636 TaxID=3154510 RepID=UPI003422A0BC